MHTRRRVSVVATMTTAVLASAVAPALAHVTLDPNSAPRGAFTELVFRAPDERDGADTTKLQVFFPSDHPLASVSVRPAPGWKVDVQKAKLATPIAGDDGQVTEAVSSITWTGDLKPGTYEDLAVTVGPLPDDADQLVFKVLQTYSDGDVVRWIELPTGGKEPDHPAPVLALTPGTTPAALSTPGAISARTSASTASDGTARSLGVAGLVVAGLALLLAAAGHVRRRRTAG